MANQIVRIFKDADMRNQHDGLNRIAQKHKVRLDQLGQGEHVLFLNARLDKVKMYSASGVLSYYRSPSGILNLNMIAFIPQCFGAEGMNWKQAEKLALSKLLAKVSKGKKKYEPTGTPLEGEA